MPAASTQNPELASVASPPRRTPWLRVSLRLVAAALVLGFGWEAHRVLIGINSHVVLPNKLYRSAQPGASDLRAAVKEYGLRTVLNLRGAGPGSDFYDEAIAACKDLGLAHHDFEFSAVRLPSAKELRRFVTTLESAGQPILLHCRRGSDRTGLTSVLAAVLLDDVPYAQAKGQLSLRFAHLTFGPTRYMSDFFRLYEDWLARTGQEPSRARLRHWLMEEYRGGKLQYARESVTPLQTENKAGQPLGFRIRYRNISEEAWEFKPQRSAGIHGVWVVGDWRDGQAKFGRSGLFEKTVGPGQTVEVTYVLPPFEKAGTYRIGFDLVEEGHAHFGQVGAEPYEEELVVRE